MNWSNIWQQIVDFFTNNAWNILWFFVALILGILVVKIVMKILRKVFNATKMEKIAQNFLLAIIKFCLCLVVVLILLSIIGVKLEGVLTAISAIILAIGMALESSIANLANGIIIVSTHMFKKGDYIIVSGIEGNIVEIRFLFTTIDTVDNKRITIPNSAIVNGVVINSGAHAKRRVDFTFSVAYESDTELVKKVVTDVMVSNGKVYLDPAPFCKLKTLDASSISFFANCWCDTEDYWDVYYYVMENVYNEFKRHNISIPYNQLEVRNRTDVVNLPVVGSTLPARVEKVREEEKKTGLNAIAEKLSKKHTKTTKKAAKTEKSDKTENTKTLAEETKAEPAQKPKK